VLLTKKAKNFDNVDTSVKIVSFLEASFSSWLENDAVLNNSMLVFVIERRLLISCLLYFGFLFGLKFYFQEVLAYRWL